MARVLAHRGRHQSHLIFLTRFQIWRRVCRIEIAPSLKRPAWHRPDRDQRRRQQKQAARRAVLLGAVLEADQALANEDGATDDPVERPAIEQFGLLFRRLMRRMVDARLTVAMLALTMLRLPLAEVLDRGGADTQFDEMQAHWIVVPQQRCNGNSAFHSHGGAWPVRAICYPSLRCSFLHIVRTWAVRRARNGANARPDTCRSRHLDHKRS